jgi:hypothetical protein
VADNVLSTPAGRPGEAANTRKCATTPRVADRRLSSSASCGAHPIWKNAGGDDIDAGSLIDAANRVDRRPALAGLGQIERARPTVPFGRQLRGKGGRKQDYSFISVRHQTEGL